MACRRDRTEVAGGLVWVREFKYSVAPEGMTEFQAAMDDLELAPRDAAQRCPFRSTDSITGFSYCYLYLKET